VGNLRRYCEKPRAARPPAAFHKNQAIPDCNNHKM